MAFQPPTSLQQQQSMTASGTCTHWPNDDRLGRRPALHLDASEWLFRHYSALGGQLAGVINSLGQKRRGAQTAIRAAQIRSHWPVKNGTAPLGPEAACISLTLNILIDCLFPRSFSSAVGCFVSTNETSVIGRAFFSLFFLVSIRPPGDGMRWQLRVAPARHSSPRNRRRTAALLHRKH